MDSRKRDLSNYRLGQSEDTLRAARKCLEEELYKDALNRSYYAAFYAVKAVLALEGKDFKRHKDAVAYFNQRYVKEEVFPREIGRSLSKLKQLREKSDYDDFYIVSINEAIDQANAAASIINSIKRYLSNRDSEAI